MPKHYSQANIGFGLKDLNGDLYIDIDSGMTSCVIHEVSDEASMLTLLAKRGDIANRSDVHSAYLLNGTNATILSNWIRLESYGLITSVNGQTGTVVLTKSDVGLTDVDNTSDVNKPISSATQSALDLKSNIDHLHDEVTIIDKGFMSSLDKVKLDAISENANEYIHPMSDGYIHVLANGNSNGGKVLTSTTSPGVHTWESPIIYSHPTGDGNAHVPINGTTNEGNLLAASATPGVTVWQAPYSYTHPSGNGDKHVPANTATTDSGKVLVASDEDGVAYWKYMYAINNISALPITLGPDMIATGAPYGNPLAISSGLQLVHLQGMISVDTLPKGNNAALFIIPIGRRPLYDIYATVASTKGIAKIKILSTGEALFDTASGGTLIVLDPGDWISLNGIQYAGISPQ